MRDNLSIVITMIVFVILVVIFPLYNYFERQDDMSYNLALKATTNFVDEVLQSGYMNQEMYDKYIYQLGDTGNIYDIELEAHHKILIKDDDSSNENYNENYNEEYIIKYNDDIFDNNSVVSNLNEKVLKGEAYYFNEGDQFYVKMKNSNTTMAGAIFNTIVPTASKDRIVVNYGGVIKNQSWSKVDATYRAMAEDSTIPVVTSDPDTVIAENNAEPNNQVKFYASALVKNDWQPISKFKWLIKKGDNVVIDREIPAIVDMSNNKKFNSSSPLVLTTRYRYLYSKSLGSLC